MVVAVAAAAAGGCGALNRAACGVRAMERDTLEHVAALAIKRVLLSTVLLPMHTPSTSTLATMETAPSPTMS